MIRIEAGVVGYAHTAIIGPIDLTVDRREVIAIVGPSGCGKTTLLRAISGDLSFSSGQMLIDGLQRDRAWASIYVARTLQNFPLLHWLTVEQNLLLAAKIKGITNLSVDDILIEFAALHLKTRYPKMLSGGERCRASLAQAVVSYPKVLLLDEPFTGLDLNVKEEIANHLFSFAQSHQSAIVFVTHDVYDACQYAHKVVVLNRRHPSTIIEVIDASAAQSIDLVRAAMKRDLVLQ